MADNRSTVLALQHPIQRGSRGRNGPFTATSVRVDVLAPVDAGRDQPFVCLAAESRRPGIQPPAEITVSLEDAVVLAETILEKLAAILGTTDVERLQALRDHNQLRAIREVLQDELGDWRELNSCADAIQEISQILDWAELPEAPEEPAVAS